MASIVLNGDTSGSVTVSVPAVSGSNTVTIPAVTGTVMVSSNMPAFSAYKSGATQNISQATWTKVTLETETFDTNNNFASSTFTPTVAGYYQINASVGHDFTTTGGSSVGVAIYKNGSIYSKNQLSTAYSASPQQLYWNGQPVSSLIYCNGSTDYIDLYAWVSGGTGGQVRNVSTETYLNGSLVRAA
jgi:hypothetical protein